MTNPLNLHLVCDASKVSECARALRQRLEPSQWAILTSLAAEIASTAEAESGSLVLVVPANRQTAAVAAALGAPGLDRAVDRARSKGQRGIPHL